MVTGYRVQRRASLEVLRAEASEELDSIVHERLLAGEDPWEFMEQLPSIDELVVFLLRVESGAPELDDRVLRAIALEHPGLTRTVWRLLGRRHIGRWAS